MDEMEIDIEQVWLAFCCANNVLCPNLLCQCLTHQYLHRFHGKYCISTSGMLISLHGQEE